MRDLEWQSEADTALDSPPTLGKPKRRRRFALPAHSKRPVRRLKPLDRLFGVLNSIR